MSLITEENRNIERMINERIKPMKQEIKLLRLQVDRLINAVDHLSNGLRPKK